jgi:phosphopantothenoylcysteine decarboxylase/phosphopantothenate--cysteine ligase
MGFALAEACADRGAKVLLVCGPVALKTCHPNIRRIDVESAEEMYDAAVAHFPTASAAILCAAVADFRPSHYSNNKIKREGGASCALELTPNRDIAAALGQMKTARQSLIGFALETENETLHAMEKLKKKNLDFIVLNSLNDAGAGFRSDTNKVTLLNAQGEAKVFPLKTKREVAEDIINETFIGK